MKSYLMAAAVIALAAPSVYAQSSNPPNQNGARAQAQASSGQNLAAAQKIKQDLQNAGFTDVKVVAESFVVQAKSKDGDPVVMTIGPHGMSVFEAMNADKSGSGTTGSVNSNSGSAGSRK